MSDIDIQKLAQLSRIEVPEEKQAQLEQDIEQVLKYVEQIQEVSVNLPDTPEASEHRNVLREDGNAHDSGEFTEQILEEAPDREGDYVKVKKIL